MPETKPLESLSSILGDPAILIWGRAMSDSKLVREQLSHLPSAEQDYTPEAPPPARKPRVSKPPTDQRTSVRARILNLIRDEGQMLHEDVTKDLRAQGIEIESADVITNLDAMGRAGVLLKTIAGTWKVR